MVTMDTARLRLGIRNVSVRERTIINCSNAE